MGNEREITKRMLDKLREGRTAKEREYSKEFVVESVEDDNYLTRAKILMGEAVENKKKVMTEETSEDTHSKTFKIDKDTPQFGDVRTSQEEAIRKTIGENITMDNGALVYYPDADDITLSGKINTLNLKFQFRYNDPSGDGCYVWTEAMQLTDSNARTLGKIRDAFGNWKDSITQDGDLMAKLKKASTKED